MKKNRVSIIGDYVCVLNERLGRLQCAAAAAVSCVRLDPSAMGVEDLYLINSYVGKFQNMKHTGLMDTRDDEAVLRAR